MATIKFMANKQPREVDVDPDMPLLWVLRDLLNLTGTKYGCGMAQCGSCTVHLDGEPIRSCITSILAADGKSVTTIEGLSNNRSHPIQKAWIAEDVPQCGYCHSGIIMTAVALLREHHKPTDKDIDDWISGHICRCGTYNRVRDGIHLAAKEV